MAKNNLRALKNAKTSKAVKEELALSFNLGHRFENEMTVDNMSLIDCYVLQGVLFVLSHRSSNFIEGTANTTINMFNKLNFFDSTSVKNLILQGDIVKADEKFQSVVRQKCPDVMFLTYSVYHKILTILFEYFNFYEYTCSEPKKSEILCQYLLVDCYYNALYTYFLKFMKNAPSEKQEVGYKAGNVRFIDEMRGLAEENKLSPEYLHYPCEVSVKEDFCKIYNKMIEVWCSEDTADEDRNAFSVFDGLDLKNDWSVLLKLLDKNYYKKPKNNKIFSLDSVYSLEPAVEIETKLKTNKSFQDVLYVLVVKTERWYVSFDISTISSCFNYYVKSVLIDRFRVLDNDKAELAGQIKELKATNRTLTRDMTKLNAENEKLKKTIDENQETLSQVQQEQSDSEELVTLRDKVSEYEGRVNGLVESLSKAQNKNTWSENRIAELEKEVKYYDGVETSMLELQNQNNVLLSDIAKIEQFEEMGADDFDIEKKYEAIKNEPIMFIGGVGDMLQRFVELFPNSENINISDNIANFNIPNRFKYVAIYTKVVKHSFCERAESIVGKDKIIFLNILNKNLVIDELYKSIIGHKN